VVYPISTGLQHNQDGVDLPLTCADHATLARKCPPATGAARPNLAERNRASDYRNQGAYADSQLRRVEPMLMEIFPSQVEGVGTNILSQFLPQLPEALASAPVGASVVPCGTSHPPAAPPVPRPGRILRDPTR